jgi:hypothetical protein
MMRANYWIIFAVLASVFSCDSSAEGDGCPPPRLQSHVDRLRKVLREATTQRESEAWSLEFFAALPDDFACYSEIFDPDGVRPLKEEEPEMSSIFAKVSRVVPSDAYIRKVVSLSVGARWDADNIEALRTELMEIWTDRTQAFTRELARLDEAQERSVWVFLFDGPAPSNLPISQAVRLEVCNASKRSCEEMDRVYDAALARIMHELARSEGFRG